MIAFQQEKMMQRFMVLAGMSVLALGSALQGNAQTLPEAASQTAPAGARWHETIQHLGAADFARREAAQKDLEQAGWRDLDFLQGAAEAATDPEIKARLLLRIAAIREDLAVNPPPVSVSFKKASLELVADTMSQVLHQKLTPWPPANPAALGQPVAFTLTAEDQPFWEVFAALSTQSQCALRWTEDGLRLDLGMNTWSRPFINGPVAVFPQRINRQRSSILQKPEGSELGKETMLLSCVLAVDPRVRILACSPPFFSTITDDAGNLLFHNPMVENPLEKPSQSGDMQALYFPDLEARLQIPEKKGTRIASAKGAYRFIAQIAEDRLDIAEPEKKVGRSFDFAGSSFRLVRFDYQPDGALLFLNLQTILNDSPPRRPGKFYAQAETPTVAVSLIDASGLEFYSTQWGGAFNRRIVSTKTPPYTLRLSAPAKTRDMRIPFELKGLPLP